MNSTATSLVFTIMQISLSALGTAEAAPRTVVLKDAGSGGSGANLVGTTFEDDASAIFPAAGEAAPFTGQYIPQQVRGWQWARAQRWCVGGRAGGSWLAA